MSKVPSPEKNLFSPTTSAKYFSGSGWIVSYTGATSSLPKPSFLKFKQHGFLKLPRLLLFPEEETFPSPRLDISYLNPLPNREAASRPPLDKAKILLLTTSTQLFISASPQGERRVSSLCLIVIYLNSIPFFPTLIKYLLLI